MKLLTVFEILGMMWILEMCSGCQVYTQPQDAPKSQDSDRDDGDDNDKPDSTTDITETNVEVVLNVEAVTKEYELPDDAPPYIYVAKAQDWDEAMIPPDGYALATRAELMELDDEGLLEDIDDVLWTATEHNMEEMAYAYGEGRSFGLMKIVEIGSVYVLDVDGETETTVTVEGEDE